MKKAIVLLCVLTLESFCLSQDEKFFNSKKYQDQTAATKMNQLWGKITEDINSYGWYSSITVGTIFFENMKPTFDHHYDHMPNGGRKKLIHSVGNVGKVRMIPESDSPYTGILSGADFGIIRLSCAKEPDPKENPINNFTPGFGLKFLRDGMPSANIIAMYSVNGQYSWNFFSKEFSNQIPEPEGFALKALGKKFSSATPYIGTLGSKSLCEYGQDGQLVQNPKFPFRLIFRPVPRVQAIFPNTYTEDFTKQLASISPGTDLYDVLAVQEPGQSAIKVATLRLESELTTSRFGDKDLFFQHSYIEDDFQIHPNWKLYLDSLKMKKSEFLAEVGRYFH